MENFVLVGTVLLTHVFAWLTPGPLFVLIIRNSLIYSRRTGIFTAVGFAVGNLVHITVAVAGIALLISRSAVAFNAIKFLGAGYLIYLGIATLFMKIRTPQIDSAEIQEDISVFSAMRIGFMTNILSIGAYLFFGSIFAGVLSSGAPTWVVAVLFITMPFNTLVMASILVTIFTQSWIRTRYTRFQHVLNKFLGGLLILLALIIAFSKR